MKNNTRKCDRFCVCAWSCFRIGNIRLSIYGLTGKHIGGIHLACLKDKVEGERGVLLNRGIAQNCFSYNEGEEAKTKA